MGCLVLSCSRSCGRDFAPVSRSRRQYAGTPRHGNHGTHPEAAPLVRSYGVRYRTNQWISWTDQDATRVAALLQDGLAGTLNHSWCPADSVHGIVVSATPHPLGRTVSQTEQACIALCNDVHQVSVQKGSDRAIQLVPSQTASYSYHAGIHDQNAPSFSVICP